MCCHRIERLASLTCYELFWVDALSRFALGNFSSTNKCEVSSNVTPRALVRKTPSRMHPALITDERFLSFEFLSVKDGDTATQSPELSAVCVSRRNNPKISHRSGPK